MLKSNKDINTAKIFLVVLLLKVNQKHLIFEIQHQLILLTCLKIKKILKFMTQ